ncbi:MAG: glycine-rich domain-containing protein, partial [Kiritimatiellia bacterium]
MIINEGQAISTGSYDVVVGDGGGGGSGHGIKGDNGYDSSFNSAIALGGGGGGAQGVGTSTSMVGKDGGSGGGGGGQTGTTGGTALQPLQPFPSLGFGHDGGAYSSSRGSGGGGAGSGPSTLNGGAGTNIAHMFTTVVGENGYVAGGGGGGQDGSGGVGGIGGGGDGAPSNGDEAEDGLPNTGGGGGGGSDGTKLGGAGGSGMVVIRYEYPIDIHASPGSVSNTLWLGRTATNLIELVNLGLPLQAELGLTVTQTWQTVDPVTTVVTKDTTNTVDLLSQAQAPGAFAGELAIELLNEDIGHPADINPVAMLLNVMDFVGEPAGLTNTIQLGAAVPTQTFNLVSSGVGTFDYTVTSPTGMPFWLQSVAPAADTLTDDATNSVAVGYATTNLALGQYTHVLHAASTNWGGITQAVSLTVNVIGMEALPGQLEYDLLQGYSADDTLAVRNTGGGAFDYGIITNQPWLSVAPATGTAAAVASDHTVTVDGALLPVGASTGLLQVVTSAGGGITQDVAVVLNMMRLERSPEALDWSLARGATHSVTQTVEVWNGGSGSLSFDAAAAPAWLEVAPSAGVSTGSADRVTLEVGLTGTASLDTGTHTGLVTLTATDGAANVTSRFVAVTVEVYVPQAPVVTAASGISEDVVQVSWPPPAAAVTGYQVRRGTSAEVGESALLGTPTDNSYTDDTAVPGQLYYYWVRGVNPHGYPGAYGSDTGYRRLSAAPGIQAGWNDDEDRVRISWQPADGVVAGYAVMRRVNTGPATLVGAATGLSFDDFTAVPGARYYYT